MHNIKYFILNKNNQTIYGGKKKISEKGKLPKVLLKSIIFQNHLTNYRKILFSNYRKYYRVLLGSAPGHTGYALVGVSNVLNDHEIDWLRLTFRLNDEFFFPLNVSFTERKEKFFR
jgi:hypothetical protein